MKPDSRGFWAMLALDFAAFALLFGLALFAYRPEQVIPSLAFRWEFAEAFLGLLPWLPALHFLGMAWSLGSLRGASDRSLSRALLPAAIISILVAAGGLIAAPSLEAGRRSILASSARFNRSLGAARAALDQGRLVEARQAFGSLESLDRDDERVRALKEALLGAELRAGRAQDSEAPVQPAEAARREIGAAKTAYLKALDFFAKRDFYSAHWEASLAFRLDPGLLEAQRLAARSWEELSGARGGEPEDAKRAAYYRRKLEGYGLLRSSDFVGAYRLFSELKAENPEDPDLRRYLAESLIGLESSAFFKDEADRAAASLSLPRFFLRLPAAAGETKALAATEAAFVEGAVYFFELEYLETRGGRLSLQLRAPYAKLAGGRLLLTAVERELPERVYRPVFATVPGGVQGAAGSGRAPGAPAGGPSSLEPGLSAEEAYRLGTARIAPESLDLLQAWQAATEARRYGLDPEPLILDLLRRLGLPFALFGASLIGTLIGLRFRAPDEGPAKQSLFALVPMLLTTLGAWYLLQWADLVASAWAARLLPAPGAIGLSASLRAAFLLAAGLLAAGSRHTAAPGHGED